MSSLLMRKSGHDHGTVMAPAVYTLLLATAGATRSGATLVFACILSMDLVSCTLPVLLRKQLTDSPLDNVFTWCSTQQTPESDSPRLCTPTRHLTNHGHSRERMRDGVEWRGFCYPYQHIFGFPTYYVSNPPFPVITTAVNQTCTLLCKYNRMACRIQKILGPTYIKCILSLRLLISVNSVGFTQSR